MLDLTTCQGLDQFGRACQIMLENSPDPRVGPGEYHGRHQ